MGYAKALVDTTSQQQRIAVNLKKECVGDGPTFVPATSAGVTSTGYCPFQGSDSILLYFETEKNG